jgi:hypothetical protein
MVGVTLAGLAEGMALADRAGLQQKDVLEVGHRVPTPPPHSPPAGRNHFNEEITPLPTGKGERYSQTISNLGLAALLR